MSGESDPFREYHRARQRMTLARVITIVGVSSALAVGLGSLAASAPRPQAVPVADGASIPTPAEETTTAEGTTTAAVPAQEPVALPEPVNPPTPAAPPETLPATGPTSWSISIDTVGYQVEIDQCLWVRMNLGAAAPIVGAHNYCGGGDVLDMALGDSVTLTGTGLDGLYLVTDARDAHAGDNAARATEGLAAAVILQSCYWSNDGTERLVALTRVG